MPEDPEVRDHPFLAVVGDDADVVAALHAEVEEPGAEALEELRELAEGEGCPCAGLVLALQGDRVGKLLRDRPVDLYDGVFHVFPLLLIAASIDKDCGNGG